jgi:RNA polymerase sigma-70 factor (ECF subfamily)
LNEEEFSVFFAAMYPRLVRFAEREVDHATADAIAASALATVWDKSTDASGNRHGDRADPSDAKGMAGARRLEAFGFGVARRMLANARRGAQRRDKLVTRLSRPDHAEGSPLDELVSRELPTWFTALRATDQELLLLVVDGYRLAEISTVLGCDHEAVKKRLHRARRRARSAFESELGKGDQDPMPGTVRARVADEGG